MVILYCFMAYFLIGGIFAILFLTRLIRVVDQAADGSPWTFKLIIFPGCVVLWPILIRKYLKARRTSEND